MFLNLLILRLMGMKERYAGLKRPSGAWYEQIHTHLLILGFQNSPIEITLYIRKRGGKLADFDPLCK